MSTGPRNSGAMRLGCNNYGVRSRITCLTELFCSCFRASAQAHPGFLRNREDRTALTRILRLESASGFARMSNRLQS